MHLVELELGKVPYTQWPVMGISYSELVIKTMKFPKMGEAKEEAQTLIITIDLVLKYSAVASGGFPEILVCILGDLIKQN